jgi:hypothetical protein
MRAGWAVAAPAAISQTANAAYSGFVMPFLSVVLVGTCADTRNIERVDQSLASEMAEIVPCSATFTD